MILRQLFKSRYVFVSAVIGLVLLIGSYSSKHMNVNPSRTIGEELDRFHDVKVFYNGGVEHVLERNLAVDGYNLGLKYQCVEFVKRYYYERFKHKMPNPLGHAKDFFDLNTPHGSLNAQRGLIQFYNHQTEPPKPEDLIVLAPSFFNHYGHVAIIADVYIGEPSSYVEIIQQNPGPFGSSRERYALTQQSGKWIVGEARVLGWLRLPTYTANLHLNPQKN